MKHPRFWRNLCLALAIAGAVAIAVAFLTPEDESLTTLKTILAVSGFTLAPLCTVIALQLGGDIRRFDALDRGEGVICRYRVSPDDWRRFSGINRKRTDENDLLWSINQIAVPETIDDSVEIVATRNALKVGDTYHSMGLGGFQGVRWVDGAPDSVEFFYAMPSGKGSTTRYVVRFPVAPGAERQVNALMALYNAPIKLTGIARVLSAPARAADRNPRAARNVALTVAVIGLTLGGVLIAQAEAPWVKEAMTSDLGTVLVVGGAVAGPIVALGALILAAVWHTDVRRRG